MKCIYCNEEISENVTICPNCGKNLLEPPKLDVNEENLTSGVTDINNSEISDYVEELTEDIKEVKERDDVEILIPSVEKKEIEENDNNISEVHNTIGEIDEFVELSDDVKAIETKNPIDKIIINIKKTKVIPKNVFIITVIIFLCLGIFTGKVVFSKNYCSTPIVKDVGSAKINTVSDGKNNLTSIGNFIYKIPDTFNYDRADNGVRIYSGDDSWVIYIKSINTTYEKISVGSVSIRETLKTSLSISDNKELIIADKNVLTYEATANVKNLLIAFTEAPNNNVFYIEIYSASNNFNYDVLDIAIDITANTEYVEHLSNMEKYQVLDKSQIALKAAEEYSSLMANGN